MEKGGVAKDGSKIIFVQGAMYDKALAPVDKWVERTTHVIDSIFPVDSTAGLVSVFIDCRPYTGMKNPPAQQLLGFFKAVQQVCYANYPGRISKVVIYPIPTLLVGLINVVKRMFTKEVREKVRNCGERSGNSPTPMLTPQRSSNLHLADILGRIREHWK